MLQLTDLDVPTQADAAARLAAGAGADGRRAQGAVPPDQFMALLEQAQP